MKIKLERKHYQWGLTAFTVIVCSMLVFFGIYRFHLVRDVLSFCVKVISPFIYGIVMAYLLCPLYDVTVNGVCSLFRRGKRRFRRDRMISKAVGSAVSVIVLITAIAGFMWMIIPGLLDSIVNVIDLPPTSMESFLAWLDDNLGGLPVAKDTIEGWINVFTESVVSFVTEKVLPHSESLAMSLSEGIIGAVGMVMDFVIGMIVCVYFLNIKDILSAQARKVIVAGFRERVANEIFSAAEYMNKTFGGFIVGKIIDSLIIGMICFVVMSAFGWEYNLLISCIICITNVIPFFGPFIGAVPSSLLLLMVNPMQCFYFIIFIFILQQFDGNILGPKILGDITGLESFWVLFAVLVGGGLFGFVGMVIGIPIFAVIYTYVSRAINRRLRRKGFSTDLNDYKVEKYRVRCARQPNVKKRPMKRKKDSEGEGEDDPDED